MSAALLLASSQHDDEAQCENHLCFLCSTLPSGTVEWALMMSHLFSYVWVKVTMSNTRASRWGSINSLSSKPEATLPPHSLVYIPPHTHTHTRVYPTTFLLTGLGQSVSTWHEASKNILYIQQQSRACAHAHTWHSSWHSSLQESVNSLLQIMIHVAKQCCIFTSAFWMDATVPL